VHQAQRVAAVGLAQLEVHDRRRAARWRCGDGQRRFCASALDARHNLRVSDGNTQQQQQRNNHGWLTGSVVFVGRKKKSNNFFEILSIH
jgi:hypothetical protein